MQIGNSQLIAKVNTRLVLHAVRVTQPTYRAAIARVTGLKPATVTAIVDSLLSQKLLREAPAEPTAARWGRPPMILRVNCDVKRILAIDLEPDRIRVAVTDLLLTERVYREELIDRFDEPQAICERIIALSRQVLRGVRRRDVLGVGVSLPGLIDRDGGLLLSSTNMPRWRDVPIRAILEKSLRLPVKIDRSIHLAALYEQLSNPSLEERTVLIVSLRTGIGASLVHLGQLYVGKGGFEGEIGHTVIDLNGAPCECGSRGCLETFVSASAIRARAGQLLESGAAPGLAARVAAGEALTPELVYLQASAGDADCAGIVREVGRYLGIATANLINLLAPHEVVISGAIDVAGELILDAIRSEVTARALPRTREGTTIRLAREREKTPLLGAAALVARDLFELPRLSHSAVRVAAE